jgi:hypothetical protein
VTTKTKKPLTALDRDLNRATKKMLLRMASSILDAASLVTQNKPDKAIKLLTKMAALLIDAARNA